MPTNASDAGWWADPANATLGSVQMSSAAKIATSLVYGTIFVSGTVGNLLVIWVIWMLRSKTCGQRSLSQHMASMACSDLLILTVGLPLELYSIIWCPYPWPIGNVGCKGFYLIWEICSYASIFNVLTFSLERYLAICHPMRSKFMARSRTRKLIGLVWTMASIAGLPVAFAIGVEDAWKPFRPSGESKPPLNICTNIPGRMALFQLVIYLSFSLYVLVLLLVAFTCRQMIKTLLGARPMSTALQRTNSPGKVLPKLKEIRRQNVVMLGEGKVESEVRMGFCYYDGCISEAAGMTDGLNGREGCIVGTLAICWFPFQARRLMTADRSKTKWSEHYYRSYLAMQPITNTLYYICSAINPFLYNVTSKQFRKMFMQILKGCCRSGSIPSDCGSHSQSDLKQESISLNGKPSFSRSNGE
ncbi:G-protein coupled receptor 39-like [Narcine bancroftii]|uniref:G-protein coupled receptor 39-like n=1 Tax=Narcine bancroftii TaxID=1343680 RepID=UPI00383223A5